ncbi:MAG: transglutaminaseTgpA domain-containing protein [Acidimicrobiia bacterium]
MTARTGSLVPAAEAALLALTLAVVLGLARLFDGGGWLGPIAANALAAHVVVGLARRRGFPLPLAAAAAAIGATLAVTWTSFPETTVYGVPSGRTWSALGTELDQAWALYQDVSAPAPAATGFVVACSAAVWLIAYVADWAAFRLWVPFEATLPAGTLFLFTALLGTAEGRGWSIAAFAGTLLAFLLVHRMARQDGSAHWVADRRQHGHHALFGVGALLGSVAVLAGTVLGPALPGADRPGLVDVSELGGDPPRTTVSPLVHIRSRLVDQTSQVLFTVEADQPAYWRLTSLDRFTGEVWSSSSDYGDADGGLPVAVPAGGRAEVLEQVFTVESLAAIWLPAAYLPQSFEPPEEVGALYDDESATLIVDREADSSDGLVYRVTSTVPRLSPEDLAGSAGEVPDRIADAHLALPDGFSPRVRELAEGLVAGAATPYEAALALQDHLRTFTYDLSVEAGHGGDALEAFLFDQQRGYCEQFAGSFAAMARAVGLPARVAVGFTQGEAHPDRPGTYVVRGEHAHAWPEVYFAGAGWVSFEPTPGRGQPFAESYTGVAPAQAASGDPGSAETLPPTTAPAQIPTATTAPEGPRPPQEDLDTTGGGSDLTGEEDPEPWIVRRVLRPLAAGLAVLLVVTTAGAAAVPGLRALRRARRHRRATTPDARIAAAWDDAVEAAAPLGFAPRRSDTPEEQGWRLSAVLPGDHAPAAAALARLRTEALYAPTGGDQLSADAAESAAADVIAGCRLATSRATRIRWAVDPRPELRAWQRDRAARQRQITAVVRGSGTADADRELERLR